jgi:predicted patatin/cPLA2 family phospholipase
MEQVDGVPMLDGGITDPVPVQRAIEQGHPVNVVVLTRNKGYRSDIHDIKVPRFVYGDYPRLRVAMSHHSEVYNRQLDMLELMERWGDIIVIRPQRPLEVDVVCRDPLKLERLYEEGFAEGERFCQNYM